jgi:hypothetical protein
LLYSLDENENNKGIIENANMLKEEEIEGALEDVFEMSLTNTYEADVNETNSTPNMPPINVNDGSQYDLRRGAPLDKLDLKIGETDVKKFNCGNHKLNIALRQAFELHEEFRDILKKINKCNSYIRNTIKLNKVNYFNVSFNDKTNTIKKIFKDKKCRLRIENLTRWSSTFLMLESVKRAYD